MVCHRELRGFGHGSKANEAAQCCGSEDRMKVARRNTVTAVFDIPEVRTPLLNSILWTARQEVEEKNESAGESKN